MRRASIYVMLLLLGANLYSCGKENFGEADTLGKGDTSYSDNNNTTPGEDGEIEEEKKEFIDTTDWSDYDDSTYLIGFGGVCEEVETVRATITMGDDKTKTQTKWVSGDEVLVYVPSKNQYGTYAYDATRKQFRPLDINNVVANKGEVAYAYYPASLYSNPTNGKVTFNLKNGMRTLQVLGENLPMSAKILSTQSDPHPTAQFKNLCSILRVQLTGCETATSVTLSNDNIPLVGGGTVAWNGDEPTLTTSGGAKSVTLSGNMPLNENTPLDFFFILPSSGTSMSEMKVSTKFTQSDGSYTYTPTLTRSRSGSLNYGRSQVVKVALRAGFFSGGDGTEANPYQIATANDLLQLSKYTKGTGATEGYNSTSKRTYFRSTVHYKQTADINCSSLGNNMNPIGERDYHFYGSYDGQNMVISNLEMTEKNEALVGLFAHVENGTLKNVILQNATVGSVSQDANGSTGALAGFIKGTTLVDNCQVISSTISGLKTGGIVGFSHTGTVSNCKLRGCTVTASGTYTPEGGTAKTGFCGGIVGGSHQVIINDCYCYGAEEDGKGTATTISGQGITGGIAGYVGGDASSGETGSGEVNRCYVSNTTITSTGDNVGGQVGRFHNGRLIGRTSDDGITYSVSSSLGDITVQGASNVGGLIGNNSAYIEGTRYNETSYTAMVTYTNITATKSYAGGICGVNAGTMQTCYVNNCKIRSYGQYCGGVCAHLKNPGKLLDCLYRYSDILASDGTKYYAYVGGYAGMMDDGTEINNAESTAYSGFGSNIEGQEQVGGLVGRMKGGKIIGRTDKVLIGGGLDKNGVHYPLNITAYYYGCSLGVGRYQADTDNVTGSISNLIVGNETLAVDNVVTNALNGDEIIGGIVGYAVTTLNINNCQQNGITIKGNRQIGGLVGRFAGNGQIANSTNRLMDFNGAGPNEMTGGICGVFENGEIYICNNFSSITATNCNYVGGIAGLFWGGDIYKCYSGGGITISGKYNVGGLVGKFGTDGSQANHCLLLCSASRSNVTANALGSSDACNAGGLVGAMDNNGTYKTNIASCAAYTATLQCTQAGAKNLGGIVGFVDDGGANNIVQACLSEHGNDYIKVNGKKAVTNTHNAGGIYGNLVKGTVKDCFYISEQTGTKGANGTTNNCTHITTTQKDNGATIASVKMSTGTTYTNKYLYELLNLTGNRDSLPITRGENKVTTYWTSVSYSSEKHAVPTMLKELGKDFYLN